MMPVRQQRDYPAARTTNQLPLKQGALKQGALMTENEKRKPPNARTDEDAIEAEVDETLEETFPSSDPPSWTLGTDHRVDSKNPVADDSED